jgi:pimeloyl-ACP methyl ester carboxylesterase
LAGGAGPRILPYNLGGTAMPSLTVNGYDMAYAEQGSGEPLVLIHGSLNDYRYWAPQMAPLGARFRVIAPSLRHYWPEKWDGSGGRFKIDQHVADMAGFIAALDAGPVRLIGHSRGGHIAFRLAELHPGLLREVVLAEPGGELDESLGGKPVVPGVKGRQAQAFAEAAALVLGEADRDAPADRPRQRPYPARPDRRAAAALLPRRGRRHPAADPAGAWREHPAKLRRHHRRAGRLHRRCGTGGDRRRGAWDEQRQPGGVQPRSARLPGRALTAAHFPDVPLRGDLAEHGTLLSIGKPRRVLGYAPR